MCSMCFLTVCGETTRIVAICLVVFPSAIQPRISASRQRRVRGELSAARNCGSVHLDERRPQEL
jgi:hypothetical protein